MIVSPILDNTVNPLQLSLIAVSDFVGPLLNARKAGCGGKCFIRN